MNINTAHRTNTSPVMTIEDLQAFMKREFPQLGEAFEIVTVDEALPQCGFMPMRNICAPAVRFQAPRSSRLPTLRPMPRFSPISARWLSP